MMWPRCDIQRWLNDDAMYEKQDAMSNDGPMEDARLTAGSGCTGDRRLDALDLSGPRSLRASSEGLRSGVGGGWRPSTLRIRKRKRKRKLWTLDCSGDWRVEL